MLQGFSLAFYRSVITEVVTVKLNVFKKNVALIFSGKRIGDKTVVTHRARCTGPRMRFRNGGLVTAKRRITFSVGSLKIETETDKPLL
jgi:hypothetical protein